MRSTPWELRLLLAVLTFGIAGWYLGRPEVDPEATAKKLQRTIGDPLVQWIKASKESQGAYPRELTSYTSQHRIPINCDEYHLEYECDSSGFVLRIVQSEKLLSYYSSSNNVWIWDKGSF